VIKNNSVGINTLLNRGEEKEDFRVFDFGFVNKEIIFSTTKEHGEDTECTEGNAGLRLVYRNKN
jgi:hypothetical protein